MRFEYDLVILGAGNAGQGVARVALNAGLKTAIVEAREVGGTCPLRGCVPKKVLVAAAEALDVIARAKAHHIDVGPATLDWAGLISRKDGLIKNLAPSMHKSLEERGAKVLKGDATFIDAHTIEIDGNKRITAEKVVVATGSTPRPLTFAGHEFLQTSEDLLNLKTLPERALFVGAGVIAFEFAHVLARAGVDVTLLEVGARPLGNFDEDAVAALVEATKALGVKLHTHVKVEAIEPAEAGFKVLASVEGKAQTFESNALFHGAGRVPNVDKLNLSAAGVETKGRHVLVDEHLFSQSAPHIGFAGDVLSGVAQLSPVATYEGALLGNNIVGEERSPPVYEALPSAVYTVPALAQVGLSESAAKKAGHRVRTKVSDLSGWLSAKTYAETTAFAKIVFDDDDGRILGAHLVGHGAQETIHAFANAIRQGLDGEAFAKLPRAYPTFHADLKHLV